MNEVKKIDKKKSIIKLLFSVIIIASIIIVLLLILKLLGLDDISQEKLQEIISSYGALGPIVFIVVSFLPSILFL